MAVAQGVGLCASWAGKVGKSNIGSFVCEIKEKARRDEKKRRDSRQGLGTRELRRDAGVNEKKSRWKRVVWIRDAGGRKKKVVGMCVMCARGTGEYQSYEGVRPERAAVLERAERVEAEGSSGGGTAQRARASRRRA